MSTLVFVLVWVLLGVGLLLVALSGGPGGALGRLQSQSRGARRFSVGAFVVLLAVLGFGVPAGVIAAVKAKDDIPKAGVTDLTGQEKHGRELFAQRCSYCHTLQAANTVATVGPNLDQLRPPKSLVLDAIAKGRANGNGQMAAGLYTGQDAQDVATFVAKAVGQPTR